MAKKNTPAKGIESLSEKDLAGLQEVKISNPLRALLKAFDYVTYKLPFKAFHATARKLEGVSKRMMVGNASLVGMPLGIVLRNAARSAYNVSDRKENKYSWIGNVAGGLAVIGAVGAGAVYGGPVAAAAVGTGWLASTVGYAAATAASGLLFHRPVFTAANLGVSMVLGAAAAAYSAVVFAPANLRVAYRRSKVSLKGVKLTEDQLAQQLADFNRNSPTARYEREIVQEVRYGLARLPHEKKERIYLDLKKEFDAAAQDAPQADAPKPANKKPQQDGPQHG